MNQAIHTLNSLNHWAVLVSAILIWLLGAVWYSPLLFAKPWMEMVQIPAASAQGKSMLKGMMASLFGDLLLAFVLWHMVAWAGAATWYAGMFVGFLCWLGFTVAPLVPQNIYEGRPARLFAINGGYWLLSLLVAGTLLAVWR